MDRREFLNVLAAAAAAGFPLASRDALAQGGAGAAMYDVAAFGNVSLLHFTDCHAQLLPIYARVVGEPFLWRGVDYLEAMEVDVLALERAAEQRNVRSERIM